MCDRLAKAYGTVKIILVTRHPLTFIPSAYVQAVKSGGATYSFHEMLTDDEKRHNLMMRVDYRILMDAYANAFGKENLLVLPFELLKHDNRLFVQLICTFLNVPEWDTQNVQPTRNEAISIPAMRFLRQVNKVDAVIGKVIRKPKHRITNRAMRRIMSLNPVKLDLPHLRSIKAADLTIYPEFADLLRNENYHYWDGQLLAYNYTFD